MITIESSFWELLLQQLYATSWLEWLGTISGFLCVLLAAKENILNWPVSIISVVAYAVLFYESKLFGDAALQVYFLWTAIYGWYYWIKRKEDEQKPIVSLRRKEAFITLGAILVQSILLSLFLDHYTSTDVPYADGLCTAISFTAQFMMTRKILQNWILWIVVDILYVPLYIYKHLMLTSILYLLFLGLAAMGYLQWRRTWKMAGA